MKTTSVDKIVGFDWRGYASGANDYLWIGTDDECFTHTTSLRSFKRLHDLLGAMIARRVAINSRKLSRARRRKSS